MANKGSLRADTSSHKRLRWTQVLPASARSLGRPLVEKWRNIYKMGKDKVRDGLAGPGVTIYLVGGCANQIFQYATGLALARRLGVDLRFDASWYKTAITDPPREFSLRLFKGVDERVVGGLVGKVIREEGSLYQPTLLENAPRKCSLVGFWQCEKYFVGLRDELRERLLPRERLPGRAIAAERAIQRAGERSVFVHVRRTDYVGTASHPVLPMEYYRGAAALVAAKIPDPEFFIFSDEPEWCEANFKMPYPTTIVRNFDPRDKHHLRREDADLYLMRQCGHAIIANSSYSWWGAWLGADVKGGIVVAPELWFGPASKYDSADIVPGRWIKL